MANTIMSAKNSFQDGLIMDFSPDSTQATCMTSALNATLLTFNGNEMSLLNDMGNARVETARLPEGYIPVGTCEFGDIIYIASYNPLTDKALIGCFPSPERNFSTEELYEDNINGYLTLTSLDFLSFKKDELGNECLTGKLKNTSVKKVLINTKKLNPGDKYIIYSDKINNNGDCLSDYGPLAEHDKLPKNIKLHVVSIEDSGKITYLDTTTNWYDMNEGNKYYISSNKIGSEEVAEYRDLVSSNWSIFNSKVSGKLAILAELEMPETFSCFYDLEYIKDTEIDILEGNEVNTYIHKIYKMYLIPDRMEDINPSWLCITKSQFENGTYGIAISPSESKGWKYPTKEEVEKGNYKIYVGDIKIPYKKVLGANKTEDFKLDTFKYNIEITPAMNYGLLEHLKVQYSIDFNKVGKGDSEIITWKYHNSNNTSILTFGLNVYPKPNWKVDDVTILFFDNLGVVAEYLLNNKKYYSGEFTEYFGLNGNNTNYRLSSYYSNGTLIEHKGSLISEEDTKNQITIEEDGKFYLNDSGTLYSGFLYAAKIMVRQSPEVGGKSTIDTYYRWFWTNPMFNEYYYLTKDFDTLKFKLNLNGEAVFETTSDYIWKLLEINNLNNDYSNNNNHNTNSANIQYIGENKESNINMYINAGLQEDYGCFNLILESTEPVEDNPDDISGIDLKIFLGESEIKYSTPEKQYEFSVKEETVSNPTYLALTPSTNKDGVTVIANSFSDYLGKSESLKDSDNVKDLFNIYFGGISQTDTDEDKIPEYFTTLDKCYYVSMDNRKAIPLSMQALLFNKAYVLSELLGFVQVPVYTPIIDSILDLDYLGIGYVPDDNKISLAFKHAISLCHTGDTFSAAALEASSDNSFLSSSTGDDLAYTFSGNNRMINIATNNDFLDTIWGNINPNIETFFAVYLGGYGDDTNNGSDHYNAVAGSSKNYISTSRWKYNMNKLDVQNKSLLTEGSFDISDRNLITNIKNNNTTSFLGVKYKNGITVFNNAFLDTPKKDINKEKNIGFSQKALAKDGIYYDNFAYLLFLLLTNTYHKNKRESDLKITLKNYVRNGLYELSLIKHIIIELSSDNKDMNIALRRNDIDRYDFKSYIKALKLALKEDTNKEIPINDSNISLELIPYAKDHELKILVKSLPMSFFGADIEAYIRKNGMLYPVNDMAPNNFYVYLDKELLLYTNGTLMFSDEDVTNTLKHIFKEVELPILKGINKETSIIYTDEDNACNECLDLIKEYLYLLGYGEQVGTEEELWLKRDLDIEDMFNSFPESINGYSINDLRWHPSIMDNLSLIFVVTLRTDNYYGYYINRDYRILYASTDYVYPNYQFNTHRFLTLFDYTNQFETKSTQQLGNTFGVRDGSSDANSAYTGFARDILLDTNYQVV